MAFTLGRFVRHTPGPALRDYFHRREIDLGDLVDWTKGERGLANALTAAVDRLDGRLRSMVYDDLERVDQLADEIGERSMVAAFSNQAMAIALFEDMEGVHSRGLWLLLNDPDLFARAEDIRFSTYHRYSRTWSCFTSPKDATIDRSDAAKARFGVRLQRLFRRLDGSGRSIEVDIFDRWDDAKNEADGRLVQVTAYVEGVPTSAVEFDQGALGRRPRRPAIEVALTYDAATGAIDVIAKGGRAVREDVARFVNRQRKLTPDRRPILTPAKRGFGLGFR